MLLRAVAGLPGVVWARALAALAPALGASTGGAVPIATARCLSSSTPQSSGLGEHAGWTGRPVDSPPAGQPIHATHPELIGPLELTPGIPAAEYRQRRRRLAALLPHGGAAILPAAATTYMAGVIPWPYRQDPDFFYLTGLLQHGLALITVPQQGSPVDCHFTLFIDPPNANRDKWDGAGISREVAREVFGADEVLHMNEMPRRLSALAISPAHPHLLYDIDRTGAHHFATATAALRPALEAGRVAPLRPLLHSLRLVKSGAEAGLMRASAALASATLRHCMACTAPGATEYGLAAAFEYGVKAAGAQRLAYPSVVASGADACTIHYGRNDKPLRSGQLVLMDAGAEYWGYCSDVTRTWPVGRGGFSGPQREVYGIVLEAHARCLAACRPGSSIRELHSLAVEVLSQGIHDLRLRPGASLEEIRAHLYRDYFWHSLGHYLGLDTHDTHLLGHDRRLAEGAVITIEPGMYIPDDPRYGPYRGIGVRIEDDVLVTAEGCVVLSDQAPVSIAEVEELAGQAAAGAGAGRAGALPLPPVAEEAPHRRYAAAPQGSLSAAGREAAAGGV